MSDSKSTTTSSDQPGYHSDKDALTKRLSRIEGQVRGVKGMVDDEAYCIDVLTQISAISKALDGVAFKLLEDHTNHCVRDAIDQGGATADERVAELLTTVQRYGKMR